jgi:predicted TIM-barrel fold metal-dependent hydrolase
MKVDVWMQHPTSRFLRQDMFAPLRRWTGTELPEGELPVSFTISSMDAAEVDVGLISAWYGPEGPLISNDEVASFVAQAPERLVGVASVDIIKPVEAVAELRRCVEELNFKALRVVPWLWRLPPNHRLYYPLYAACVELGIPFCTQVGHTGPLRPSDVGRPIPYLEEVALDFPDLVIVGGHIGHPWTDEMILLARKFPNVYIDTSAYTVRRYPRVLVDYLRAGGRNKVMFGTNFPMLTAEQALKEWGSLELDQEAAGLFMGENAERVFKLG